MAEDITRSDILIIWVQERIIPARDENFLVFSPPNQVMNSFPVKTPVLGLTLNNLQRCVSAHNHLFVESINNEAKKDTDIPVYEVIHFGCAMNILFSS